MKKFLFLFFALFILFLLIVDLTVEDPILQNKINVSEVVVQDIDLTTNEKEVSQELPVFNTESLAKYDGTDPTLPIYIALDGNVYDVTKGKEFYAPGGHYDHLAGTNGSALLKIFGGKTIKEKYPVVGVFSE